VQDLDTRQAALPGKPTSTVKVDNTILGAKTLLQLLFYFTCVLKIFQHHRVTVKLKKTCVLPKWATFVAIDVMREGKSPVQSKNEAIQKITPPIFFGDLSMLFGFIGFYCKWIQNYKDKIGPHHRKHAPSAITNSWQPMNSPKRPSQLSLA
jgi:hypothetical protein